MFGLRNQKNIFFIFYGLVALTCILILWQLGNFIYENAYKTAYDSDQVVILHGMIAIEPINTAKFQKVMANFENKTKTCAELNK